MIFYVAIICLFIFFPFLVLNVLHKDANEGDGEDGDMDVDLEAGEGGQYQTPGQGRKKNGQFMSKKKKDISYERRPRDAKANSIDGKRLRKMGDSVHPMRTRQTGDHAFKGSLASPHRPTNVVYGRKPLDGVLFPLLRRIVKCLHNWNVFAHSKDGVMGTPARFFGSETERFYELTGMSYKIYSRVKDMSHDDCMSALEEEVKFGGSESILGGKWLPVYIRGMLREAAKDRSPLYIDDILKRIRALPDVADDHPDVIYMTNMFGDEWKETELARVRGDGRWRTVSSTTLERFMRKAGFKFGLHGKTTHPLKEGALQQCDDVFMSFLL